MSVDIIQELELEKLRQKLLKYTREAYYLLPEMDKPNILDIGCGTGIPTLELAELSNGEITGIDIDGAALDKFKKRVNAEDALEAFEQALENAKPSLEVKSRRIGGATYQVPIEVAPDRRTALAMRWIIGHARKKVGKSMEEGLAMELAPYGIRVNAIAPGPVATPLMQRVKKTDPGSVANLMKTVLLGRWGHPADIAKAAIYLASDAADWVTGTTLVVDGGVQVRIIPSIGGPAVAVPVVSLDSTIRAT